MATYTFDTNARQEAGLAFALGKLNAERAAENPPKAALNAAQYFTGMVTRVLNSYADQADDEDAGSLRELYKAASPAQKAAMREAAGR